MVDIVDGLADVAFPSGKITHLLGDSKDDVGISSTDALLIFRDFIIIHKLAEIGCEGDELLFCYRTHIEVKGVVSRKHTQELLRLLLEVVKRTTVLINQALQLFHDGKTIFGGDFLSYFITSQWAQSFVTSETHYCFQACLQFFQGCLLLIQLSLCYRQLQLKTFTTLPEFIFNHRQSLSLVLPLLSYNRFLIEEFYLIIPVNRYHITIFSDKYQLSIQFCYALVVSIQSLGIHTLAMQFIVLCFQEFLLTPIHLVLLLFYLRLNIVGKDFKSLCFLLNLSVVFRLKSFQLSLQFHLQLALILFLLHLIGNKRILLIFQF